MANGEPHAIPLHADLEHVFDRAHQLRAGLRRGKLSPAVDEQQD